VTPSEPGIAGRAAELRLAFDRSFAEAPRAEPVRLEDLLAFRVAGDPYAVRLADTRGLFADRKIVRLPSPARELLGVAGFRGAVVPVYDLRALLGYPAAEAPRWLFLAAHASAVGLAFDRFDGQLRVPSAAIVAGAPGEALRPHVREVLRAHDLTRSILDVFSVLEAVKTRSRQGVTQKER
jgi:purine-binding chemotaxis protein CheW